MYVKADKKEVEFGLESAEFFLGRSWYKLNCGVITEVWTKLKRMICDTVPLILANTGFEPLSSSWRTHTASPPCYPSVTLCIIITLGILYNNAHLNVSVWNGQRNRTSESQNVMEVELVFCWFGSWWHLSYLTTITVEVKSLVRAPICRLNWESFQSRLNLHPEQLKHTTHRLAGQTSSLVWDIL